MLLEVEARDFPDIPKDIESFCGFVISRSSVRVRPPAPVQEYGANDLQAYGGIEIF